MAATVGRFNVVRLRSFCSAFYMKNMRELICLLVTICLLTSQSLANDQDFMEEFLKREYSLAKPYRGELKT